MNKSRRQKAEGRRQKAQNRGRKMVFLFSVFCFLFSVLLSGCSARPGVYIKQLKNKHYQLIVNGKPYIVKGVCYNPVPVGKNHEYDWWSDPAKPWIADGKLMQEMGVNTIRLYQAGNNPQAVKQVIGDLYKLYGIRAIMGDWLGFWEYPFPFYADKKFQDKVKTNVLEMVKLYKDEQGLLMWVLGNENNYSSLGRVNPWTSDEIDQEPDPQKRIKMRLEIYYSFVNEMSKEIHKIDSQHPVALGNGELSGLEVASKYAADVDLVACIIYRGKTFGNLFRSLKMTFDKPLLFAEFGADCYDAYAKKENQHMQAFFLELQWREIYENLANVSDGQGNCIGGAIFEWTDEWWKHDQGNADGWLIQDVVSNWSNGSYYFDIRVEGGMNMNEEWFGIVGLSEKLENGLNKRIPREAYYTIKEFWKNPSLKKIKGKKAITS